MMVTGTAGKQAQLTAKEATGKAAGNWMTRKIWLPKALYAALPVFYLISGATALLTTLYISNWAWVLPHYLLFGVACLHMGILVFRRRHRRDGE